MLPIHAENAEVALVVRALCMSKALAGVCVSFKWKCFAFLCLDWTVMCTKCHNHFIVLAILKRLQSSLGRCCCCCCCCCCWIYPKIATIGVVPDSTLACRGLTVESFLNILICPQLLQMLYLPPFVFFITWMFLVLLTLTNTSLSWLECCINSLKPSMLSALTSSMRKYPIWSLRGRLTSAAALCRLSLFERTEKPFRHLRTCMSMVQLFWRWH